jgi:thiamine pyrophosphate-dependent acetolactate synthase large subunit-like protein/CDGSH-type Zn-finger protein
MDTDKPKKRPTIRCRENGPYLVKGLEDLRNSRGDPIAPDKSLALCRCGASKTKPFCDGTHKSTGFSGEKQPDRVADKCDTYIGKGVTIHDNRGACAHAGICTDRLASVWRMGKEPWIDPDGAEVDAIIEIIKLCPSGALSYSIGEEEYPQQDQQPAIQLAKNGPYQVRGGIELEGIAFAEGASRERYTLCRCGASKNKPFCDGSHWDAGFEDNETGAAPAEAAAATKTRWYRVADLDELSEGAVKTVTAGATSVALTHYQGQYGALDNRCPHQGGPLGEGTIEDCWLRCPWHGWDFHPLTGKAPQGHDDEGVATHPVELREDGVYVAVEESSVKAPTVSNVMVDTMVNWGITHVFGMVGHSNLGLADAIRVQEMKGNLTYIGIRHEGAAAFACSGFAKLSGKPAACLSIAGPGATNLLTGLWDAKVDRAPVLALTGQVETQVLGPGAFQEIDQASAFEAVATFSQTVLPTSKHAELMTLALKHAVVKRDVAHLIFPDEVQTIPAEDKAQASRPDGRIGSSQIAPPEAAIEAALEAIVRSKRPAIVIGYGARESMASVVRLAERLNAPVLTTFKAKGQIPDDHPLAAGVLGRSGTPIASWVMNESDQLIVFGASFSHHTGIAPNKPTIQVDFEQMALGKFHAVDVPVWGEIGRTAKILNDQLPKALACEDQRADVAARWRLWREEKARRAAQDRGKGVNSAAIFAALSSQAPDDAVISVDVGNNTYAFGRYFECKRQSVLMSGYLGSIGFGFPAAMGAWAAAPDRTILSVSGDGGFGQYLAEFTTAVKYGMNITHVLLNNGELGKISKEQRAGQWKVWQTALHNPNFADFAINCGGYGVRVTEVGALAGAIKDAIGHEGPALVEIMSDAELI